MTIRKLFNFIAIQMVWLFTFHCTLYCYTKQIKIYFNPEVDKYIVFFGDDHILGNFSENQNQFEGVRQILSQCNDFQILAEGGLLFNLHGENPEFFPAIDSSKYDFRIERTVFFPKHGLSKMVQKDAEGIWIKIDLETNIKIIQSSWNHSLDYYKFLLELEKEKFYGCDPRINFSKFNEIFSAKDIFTLYKNIGFEMSKNFLSGTLSSNVTELLLVFEDIMRTGAGKESVCGLEQAFEAEGFDGLIKNLKLPHWKPLFGFLLDYNIVFLSLREEAPKWTFITAGSGHNILPNIAFLDSGYKLIGDFGIEDDVLKSIRDDDLLYNKSISTYFGVAEEKDTELANQFQLGIESLREGFVFLENLVHN